MPRLLLTALALSLAFVSLPANADERQDFQDICDAIQGSPATKEELDSNVVACARSQVGLVKDYQNDGSGRRVGWERLVEYHEKTGAFGANSRASLEKAGSGLSPWCGVFALWALKSAGVTASNWKVGSGIAAVLPVRSRDSAGIGTICVKTSPILRDGQPVLDANDNPTYVYHHALVVGVNDDDTLQIVNGNGGPNGGEVSYQASVKRSTYGQNCYAY